MKLISLGPNQTHVIIGSDDYYFSYNACVALRNKYGEFRIKSPSVATTRHMRKMGVSSFTLISEKEFAQYIPTRLPPLQGE